MCAYPGTCDVYMSTTDCASAGITSGRFDIYRLRGLITDPSLIGTLREARTRCPLAHELRHITDGCGLTSCSSEQNGQQAQLDCLSAVLAAKCNTSPPQWSAHDCSLLNLEICQSQSIVAFQLCRCNSGAPNKGDPCPTCVSQCLAAQAQCNSQSPSDMHFWCEEANQSYCDGIKPSPTPVVAPAPTKIEITNPGGTVDTF